MTQLTNAFYIISTALLIPVMLVLLVQLVQVLLNAGALIQEFVSRSSESQQRSKLARALEGNSHPLPEITGKSLVPTTVRKLVLSQGDQARQDYYLRQAEIAWNGRVEPLKNMTKLGPALGLMGTLIPLGPALVGLAVGDIATMSQNLVIAFATTVVGLLVGMVASTMTSIRRRWYQQDAALLSFAAERLAANPHSPIQANAKQFLNDDACCTGELASCT
jgi:biopolymer transport protein ExbB/TolQ